MFLVAQACDGIFTYAAIAADGLAAEGNLILATWMGLIGPGPALMGAKLVACFCGMILYERGVHRTLAVLTMLYAVAAVGPWLLILRHY